jgi:hypothetical protein
MARPAPDDLSDLGQTLNHFIQVLARGVDIFPWVTAQPGQTSRSDAQIKRGCAAKSAELLPAQPAPGASAQRIGGDAGRTATIAQVVEIEMRPGRLALPAT